MKRFSILILACLCLTLAQAQTNHLKFKGVPINGTLEQFTRQLVKKGCTLQNINESVSYLRGDVSKYKDCIILCMASPMCNSLVYQVSILSSECTTWEGLDGLYTMYRGLKKLLIQKYGEPAMCYEEFTSDTEPEDDETKFLYACMKKCLFSSVFQLAEGEITLGIAPGECRIMLIYKDKINSEKVAKKEAEDL